MSQLSLSDFADIINQIMPLLAKEFARMQMKELCKDKITLPQLLILDFLHKEGESKMSYLAHFMSVTTAAMTGIVDRMVGGGYIERIYEPQDRRIIKVRLTTRGNELIENINEQKRRLIIRIFGRISERDRQEYLRILTQIKEILSKEGRENKP